MTMDGLTLREINDKAAGIAEQDQTSRFCRMILLYTQRKISGREQQGQC